MLSYPVLEFCFIYLPIVLIALSKLQHCVLFFFQSIASIHMSVSLFSIYLETPRLQWGWRRMINQKILVKGYGWESLQEHRTRSIKVLSLFP